jgi:hypothetical protein
MAEGIPESGPEQSIDEILWDAPPLSQSNRQGYRTGKTADADWAGNASFGGLLLNPRSDSMTLTTKGK